MRYFQTLKEVIAQDKLIAVFIFSLICTFIVVLYPHFVHEAEASQVSQCLLSLDADALDMTPFSKGKQDDLSLLEEILKKILNALLTVIKLVIELVCALLGMIEVKC